MIKDFFKVDDYLFTSFGITEERAESIMEIASGLHNQMIMDMVDRNYSFDKSSFINALLQECNNLNEEAFALFHSGARIERLENKLKVIDQVAQLGAIGPSGLFELLKQQYNA